MNTWHINVSDDFKQPLKKFSFWSKIGMEMSKELKL